MSEKQVVKGSVKKKKEFLSDCVIVLYLSEDCDNWDGCWRGCWYVGADWSDFLLLSGLNFLEWVCFCWWVVMQRVCQKHLLLDMLGREVWRFDLESTHSFVNTQAAAPGMEGGGGEGVWIWMTMHAFVLLSLCLLLSSGLWSFFRSWFAVASSPGCRAFWLLLNYRTLRPVFWLCQFEKEPFLKLPAFGQINSIVWVDVCRTLYYGIGGSWSTDWAVL